jgi:hypothetical protein
MLYYEMANNTVYTISQKISTLLFVLLWETSLPLQFQRKTPYHPVKKVHTAVLLRNVQYVENIIRFSYEIQVLLLDAEPATTTSKIEASGFCAFLKARVSTVLFLRSCDYKNTCVFKCFGFGFIYKNTKIA